MLEVDRWKWSPTDLLCKITHAAREILSDSVKDVLVDRISIDGVECTSFTAVVV